jgi:mannose-6-phosphate isomerase-like protein (cupin superfamily)
MRILLVIISFLFNLYSLHAQKIELQPNPQEDYDNISVKKIHSDKDVSSFHIWLKEHVKPHKHNKHTEHVYIVAGEGNMLLGDTIFSIAKGDLIVIPRGTVHAVLTKGDVPLQANSIQAPQFFNEDREWVDVPNWPELLEKP